MPYSYDPGHHRRKHCSDSPRAYFAMVGSALIGKCPATIDRPTAQALLTGGIPEIEAGEAHPSCIYAVHDGVIYMAVPTRPGTSYHGFPWRGRPGHNRIARPIKRLLLQRALQLGQEADVKKWFAEHES